MRRLHVASVVGCIFFLNCVLALGGASQGAEPARFIVANSVIAEPLGRLVAGRATVHPFRAKHDESATYEALNARWCAASTSGAKAFVFGNASYDPLDALWRERLANQGSRTFTVGVSSRRSDCAASAPLLRQLHAMLVELMPDQRAHWDANLERELEQLAPQRSRDAAVELAVDQQTSRPAPR